MLPSPQVLEAEQGERFLRRAVSGRCLYAVASENGLARSPSRRSSGREAALLWSAPEAAESWASTQPGRPRVKELPLNEVLLDMLPGLANHQRMVGLDWTGNSTAVPELDPAELGGKLRAELLESFLARVVMFGAVWTLGDADGPSMMVSITRSEALVLPVWSDERQAGARIDGPWRDCLPMRIRMDDFVRLTLPGLERQRALVAPEHMFGPGVIELEAADLRSRISARRISGD